jgi:RHS repeat-associated protein
MKNKFKVTLSLFSIIILFNLTTAQFATAQNMEGGGYESELREKPVHNPQAIEITSKRTLRSKAFLNSDSTISVKISNGYMHYKDTDGKYKEINRKIIAVDSNNYCVKQGLYEANFSSDLFSDRPFKMKLKDNTMISWSLANMVYYEQSSKKINKISELMSSHPVTDNNTITYQDIFPGINLRLIYEDTQLKEEIIMTQKARENLPKPEKFAFKTSNTYLMFLFEINPDKNLTTFVNKENKQKIDFEGNEKIDFKDNRGKSKFFFPMDWAFMENDRDNPFAEYYKLHKRVFYEDGKMFLLVGMKYKKLNKLPGGTIVFDPTTSMQPDGNVGKDTRYGHNGSSSAEFLNFGAHYILQIHANKWSSNYYGGRTIIQYDLSCIPNSATIQSAKLFLYDYYHSLFRDTENHYVLLHEISRSWFEGTGLGTQTNDGADFQRYDGINYWINDGGDYNSTLVDFVTFNKYQYNKWQEFNVTNSVQTMVTGSISNYGWLLKWDNDIGSGRVDASALFYSSDYTGDVSKRPYLEVTYKVDPIVSYDYDALGRITTATYANDVEEINQFDSNRGWLVRRDYKRDGNNIYYFKSTGANDFDAVGNLLHVEYKHKSDLAETMDYSYNDLYQLNQFKKDGNVSRNYDYDPNGNLNTFTGKTLTYGNDNNQLTNDGSRNFIYDNAGKCTNMAAIAVDYDFRGLMTKFDDNSQIDITSSYDAFGQRIRKTENGGSSKYYVTSGPQILAEYSSNSEPDAEYIYANGRKISKYDPSQGYLWFYADHLGNTRLMDGSDENHTDMRRDYYPYGEAYTTAGNDQTSYQFSQKELDNGIGFYYFGARHYDPSIGRWLTPDPAGQGFSPYVYCGNRPLVMVDPDGQIAWFVPILIGAGLNTIFNSQHIHNGWDFLGYAGIGAIGGAMSMFGNPGAWYGMQNILIGGAQGALTGGLNSALGAHDWNAFGSGAKTGAIWGASFGLATTEQFRNTLRGNFWQSDQQVFQQFVDVGNMQGAIDYFGGNGAYDPNHQFFRDSPSASAGTRDVPTLETIYGDPAFTNANHLKEVIYHENFHRSQFLSGDFTMRGLDFNNDLQMYEFRSSIELPAWTSSYKNQGLFRTSVSTWKIERWTGMSGKRWWHSIYKLPRRFGKF